MLSRNLILILIAGVILAIGAVGAARRDADRDRTQATTVVSPAPAPTGGLEANIVKATLPADRVVRARVGDDIELRVTSQSPDIAKILAFGVQAPVGPGIPGVMRFEALTPGSYDVLLELAGRRAGRVQVTGGDARSSGAAG